MAIRETPASRHQAQTGAATEARAIPVRPQPQERIRAWLKRRTRQLRHLLPGLVEGAPPSAVEWDGPTIQALAERWTLTVLTSGVWLKNTWLGFPILQLPNDLLMLQELIVRAQPRVIIETGTYGGGTAIFYASILSLTGGGRVISVDVNKRERVRQKVRDHPLGKHVMLMTGDSVAPETLAQLRRELAGETQILVALDSDHSYEHVLSELRAYHEFVPIGGYLVVFDTVTEALSKLPGYEDLRRDNPKRAVMTFLREHPEFDVDNSCDRLLESFCLGGFLRRVR